MAVSVTVQRWGDFWSVSGAHVPLVGAPAATLQTSQSLISPPPHAVSQHTPSTQKPLAYCGLPVHATPFTNVQIEGCPVHVYPVSFFVLTDRPLRQ